MYGSDFARVFQGSFRVDAGTPVWEIRLDGHSKVLQGGEILGIRMTNLLLSLLAEELKVVSTPKRVTDNPESLHGIAAGLPGNLLVIALP